MAKQDPLVVDSFYRSLCTRKLLLEICVVDETVDFVNVQVELDPSVCYVDKDKYVENGELVM